MGRSGGGKGLDWATGGLLLAVLWSVVVCGQAFASDTEMTADGGALADAPASDQPRRGILPAGRLFDPLVADPRWPHFSASYQRYLDDGELKDVGAASFGEYFSLYRNQVPSQGGWELGLQAGVFAIFDLGASSQDLVNADYWVGIPVAYRRGDFSTVVRLFHQSSHLGDEFLLRNRAERVNLSYEGIDLLLSWDVAKQWRLYGGGGYLFHRQPSSLDPGRCRAGIEWRHDDPFFERMVRPVAAVDASLHQENQWDAEVSARAGVQLENPARRGRHLQLLFEYFKGNSPNGQFFRRRIEYWGAGLHLYLP